MVERELFKYPTVKKVIFQIKFPNLFYIEKHISDYQLDIIKRFPQSKLIHQREFFFGITGEIPNFENNEKENLPLRKIWTFNSNNGIVLNITSDSIDISSDFHKTYNLSTPEDNFRDVIIEAINPFFKYVKIPILTRIGLRYIDECPINTKTNRSFRLLYNSAFPLSRFDLSDSTEMDVKVVIKKGDFFLKYIESLQNNSKGKPCLIIDTDAFAQNIPQNNFIDVADQLHDIISKEFFATLKPPMIEKMRGKSSNGRE
jgi:uncharacterized protein (TIGR04255 family)